MHMKIYYIGILIFVVFDVGLLYSMPLHSIPLHSMPLYSMPLHIPADELLNSIELIALIFENFKRIYGMLIYYMKLKLVAF